MSAIVAPNAQILERKERVNELLKMSCLPIYMLQIWPSSGTPYSQYLTQCYHFRTEYSLFSSETIILFYTLGLFVARSKLEPRISLFYLLQQIKQKHGALQIQQFIGNLLLLHTVYFYVYI